MTAHHNNFYTPRCPDSTRTRKSTFTMRNAASVKAHPARGTASATSRCATMCSKSLSASCTLPLLSYITNLLTTPQPRRLLHRMRQLPRLRHHPTNNLAPALPLTQPGREVRHSQARAQLQRHDIQRIQHGALCARRRGRSVCVRQLSGQDCAVLVYCVGALGHCACVLARHG
jgi:hypothetical protein